MSYVRTAHSKTYVVANGQPYLMYGVHLRLDTVLSPGFSPQKWTLADDYFRHAADLGFRSVIVPVPWPYIQPSEGRYDFASYVNRSSTARTRTGSASS